MAVIAVPGAGKTHCLIARMVRMIKNTVVASRTLKSNLTNKLLDMMTSDWFLKVLESNKSNID